MQVRFHDILDDDMNVVRVNPDGSLTYSFYNVDQVYDYILSIGPQSSLSRPSPCDIFMRIYGFVGYRNETIGGAELHAEPTRQERLGNRLLVFFESRPPICVVMRITCIYVMYVNYRVSIRYKAITSEPQSWQQWGEVISVFVSHLVDRYGLAEVRRNLLFLRILLFLFCDFLYILIRRF